MNKPFPLPNSGLHQSAPAELFAHAIALAARHHHSEATVLAQHYRAAVEARAAVIPRSLNGLLDRFAAQPNPANRQAILDAVLAAIDQPHESQVALKQDRASFAMRTPDEVVDLIDEQIDSGTYNPAEMAAQIAGAHAGRFRELSQAESTAAKPGGHDSADRSTIPCVAYMLSDATDALADAVTDGVGTFIYKSRRDGTVPVFVGENLDAPDVLPPLPSADVWQKELLGPNTAYSAASVQQAQRDAKAFGYALGRAAAVREYISPR